MKAMQHGQKEVTVLGDSFTEEFKAAQNARAEREEIREVARLTALRQSHLDGKRSALSISYANIASNVSVLDNVTPFSSVANSKGEILLWQGYRSAAKSIFEPTRGDRGPLFRVIQDTYGQRRYERYDATDLCWVQSVKKDAEGNITKNRFAPINIGVPPLPEQWSDVPDDCVQRTVMADSGHTERRVYQNAVTRKKSS